MSQLLVAVYNNTANSVYIWNSETASNNATIAPSQVFVIQGSHGHWNIPDCSGQSYFAQHHMEIRPNPTAPATYSFWDDDNANYILQTCPGTKYDQRTTMTGASDLGNNANVMILVDPRGLVAVAAEVGASLAAAS
jgi:hypothetical protein